MPAAGPAFFALAGCLALVSTIFDAADGMLARAKGLTSRYGAFLDLFLDRVADFAVLAGATYGYFRYVRSYPLPRLRTADHRPLFPPARALLHQPSLHPLRKERRGRRGQEPGRLPHLRLFHRRPPGRDPGRGLPHGLPRHGHQDHPVPAEGQAPGGGSGPPDGLRRPLPDERDEAQAPPRSCPTNRRIRMTAMPADISIRSRAKSET